MERITDQVINQVVYSCVAIICVKGGGSAYFHGRCSDQGTHGIVQVHCILMGGGGGAKNTKKIPHQNGGWAGL